MTVAIVTAIFGGYDVPKPIVEQDIDVRSVLVSEDEAASADGWETRWAPTAMYLAGGDPRIACKLPKVRPWTIARECDAWIYVDASFEITSPSFASEILELSTGVVNQYAHPQRDDIYDEASFTAQYAAKYADVPVLEQAAHYATTGHPRNWGMWNTGVIVYREPVEYLAALWEAEIKRWGPQCQISQPVALRRAGIRPHTLPGVVYDTPWMTHHAHIDGTR